MLRSLRFQLPAFFLLGVVLAGIVSAAIALRLFQSYAQNRARAQDYRFSAIVLAIINSPAFQMEKAPMPKEAGPKRVEAALTAPKGKG